MAPAFREQAIEARAAIEKEIKAEFEDAERESLVLNRQNESFVRSRPVTNYMALPENVQVLHNKPQLPPVSSIPRRQYKQLSEANELRIIPPTK